jgi:YVTN family beta-propeller protein
MMTKFHVAGDPDMPTLSPDESQLLVSGRYRHTATVIDTGTLRVLTTFVTGRSPHGLFVTRTSA